jgi:hypothetical protein
MGIFFKNGRFSEEFLARLSDKQLDRLQHKQFLIYQNRHMALLQVANNVSDLYEGDDGRRTYIGRKTYRSNILCAASARVAAWRAAKFARAVERFEQLTNAVTRRLGECKLARFERESRARLAADMSENLWESHYNDGDMESSAFKGSLILQDQLDRVISSGDKSTRGYY